MNIPRCRFSVAKLCPTLCDLMDCSMPVFTISQSFLQFISIESVMPSNHLSHPLSALSPPAFNLSQHQSLFQGVSSWHQVAKRLEFQTQHPSFQWTFRSDFVRIDWLDLLAVQGILKSLLQNHNLKASIFWPSAFFNGPTLTSVDNSYMTTGKNIPSLCGSLFSKWCLYFLICCLALS